MTYNKIYAVIGDERHIVLDPINYQYDVKQILVISGETVPDYYEADVCNVGDTATLTMVGTAADGVEIPDKFLLDGRNVLVYVVIPGSGGDVQTRYDITIPVDERAEREDIDPSEAEQQQIDSLVAALSSGVGRAEAAATAAAESATAADGSAEDAEAWAVGQRAGEDVPATDPTYHNNSKYYAGMAEAAAEEARQHEASWETWVQRAETAAGNAESSATAAGQSKTAAETAAQAAAQKATEAGNSAAAASSSAASARQTVDGAIGAINTARDGALTAIGSAGSNAVGAVEQAGTTQTGRVTSEGNTQVNRVQAKGDEVLDSIPQDYSDLVDDVADLTRQLSDVSGSLATVETTSTASKAYAVGDLLVYNNQLYKVASAIAAGGTLTPRTNITAVTVETEINNAVGSINVPISPDAAVTKTAYIQNGEAAYSNLALTIKNGVIHINNRAATPAYRLLWITNYFATNSGALSNAVPPVNSCLPVDLLNGVTTVKTYSSAFISGVQIGIKFVNITDNVVTELGYTYIDYIHVWLMKRTLTIPEGTTHFAFYIYRSSDATTGEADLYVELSN